MKTVIRHKNLRILISIFFNTYLLSYKNELNYVVTKKTTRK